MDAIVDFLGSIPIFSLLDKIPWWRNLPYPTKGALLRTLKAGVSVIIGLLVAATTQGILFPASWGPGITLVVTAFLQGADKFLRELKAAKAEENADIPPEEVSTEATDKTDVPAFDTGDVPEAEVPPSN